MQHLKLGGLRKVVLVDQTQSSHTMHARKNDGQSETFSLLLYCVRFQRLEAKKRNTIERSSMLGRDQWIAVCAPRLAVASCGRLHYNQHRNDQTEEYRRRLRENDLSHDANLHL
jgi:hypothetical protein